MAKIDLSTTESRIENGLSIGTVALPSHHRSNKHQQKRGRGETIIAIIDAVYDASEPLSRLEIARAIGRAKTPHLTAMIEELVNQNVLKRISTVSVTGAFMFLYGRPEALNHE